MFKSNIFWEKHEILKVQKNQLICLGILALVSTIIFYSFYIEDYKMMECHLHKKISSLVISYNIYKCSKLSVNLVTNTWIKA